MTLFGGDPLLFGFQEFTDERRDNVPAFLCSMWFCASMCCALMWRHALRDVLKYRLAKADLLQPRLYWFCYFWALESAFGLLACRSVNYTAEELRGEKTSAVSKMFVILTALTREFFANAACLTIMLPWEYNISPKWIFITSCMGSGLLGRSFSFAIYCGYCITIYQIVNNTKAYQGQEAVSKMFKAFAISAILYGTIYLTGNSVLAVWFNLVCWCTLKVLVNSFWQLDSYYWDQHQTNDHKLQYIFIKKLSSKKTD
jgi:hypothetical protein